MGICTAFTPLGFSEFDTYHPETIVFTSRATVEQVLNLKMGIYKLEIVGAGGGGGGVWSGNGAYFPGGGSGAAFVGEIFLEEGVYKYKVGTKGGAGGVNAQGSDGGSSYFRLSNNNIVVEAGGGGTGIFGGGAGAGGVISVDNDFVISKSILTNGMSGTGSHLWSPVPGGLSVYNGLGFGASSTGAADDGYLRLTYLRQSGVERF